MSMRGSPIGWFKDKRQSSHSGIPGAKRPQTAFPWNEDRDISKIVEQAVLAAFESNAFKIAVASQVDPAFARHQEKLNQIKTTNLNLESTLQAHVEDIPALLNPIQNHLTGLIIPDYGQDLEALAVGQERLEGRLNDLEIPEYGKELSDLASGQARLLKTIESRFDGLESRVEDLDRKISDLDEAVVNADLRSAIRFGEISNELQDRNTTLGDRVWGVERELGKKIDALQRKVVAACEDVGKTVRSNHEIVETVRAKLDEDDVLAAINKANSRAEFSEKGLRRSITAIQEKVSNLDTSAISSQTARLEVIERGLSDFKKEAEAARNLASVSSKFLSANTTKLDSIAAAVGKMQIMVESTNELSQDISESQESNAGSIKEDVEAVRMHVRSLDNLAVSHGRKLSDAASSILRMDKALIGSNAAAVSKLEELESSLGRVEEGLKPLSSHTIKLDNLQSNIAGVSKDVKPHKTILDDLASTLLELRSNIDTALSSHTESLDTIQQTVFDTSSLDQLASNMSEMQAKIERQITSSLESTTKSTVEQITSQIGVVDLKLQAGFNSVAEDANFRADKIHVPITEVLEEIRSSKAFLEAEKAEILDGFRSTKQLVETGQVAHIEEAKSTRRMLQDAHEASKEDEILLQIESWSQNCISKQASELSAVKDLLIASRERDETLQKSVVSLGEKHAQVSELLQSGNIESSSTLRELGAIKSILENDEKFVSVKEIASNTEQKLDAIQTDLQQIKDHSAIDTIKQSVLQNAASMATAYEGILAIDTKIQTSQETLQSIVREVQAALATDILDATASVTASANDGFADVKADFSTRISTSTNVLRAELKTIDVAPTTAALEALKEEISVSSKANQDHALSVAEDVKSTVKSSVESISKEVKEAGDLRSQELQENSKALAHLREVTSTVAEDVNIRIGSAVELLGKDVRDFGNVHSKELQQTAVALSNIEAVTKTHATSITEYLTSIQKAIEPISETTEDVAFIVAAVKELDQAAKSSADSFSTIQKSVTTTGSQLDIVSSDLQTAIKTTGSKTVQAIEANNAIVSELRQAGSEQHAKVCGDIEDLDSALVKISVDIGKANTSLVPISSTCQVIPQLREDTQHIESLLLDASKESKVTQASIFASLLGVTEEAKSVKSDISGVAASLHKAEEGRSAAVTAQADILSVVQGNASELQQLQESLKRADIGGKESFDALEREVSGLKTIVVEDNEQLKSAILVDLASVKSQITTAVKDVNASVEKTTVEAGNAQGEFIATLKSDVKAICDLVNQEAEQTKVSIKSNLEAAQVSILLKVENTKKALSSDLTGVQTSIQEYRNTFDAMSTGIHGKLDTAATELFKTHEITLGEIKLESKSLSETILRESQNMTGAIDLAKGFTVADAQQTKIFLDSNINLVQKTLQETLGNISQDISTGFNHATSEATKLHETTLDALKAEGTSLSDKVAHEAQNTSEALDTIRKSLSSEIQTTNTSLASVGETVTTFSRDVRKEFEDAANDRKHTGTTQDTQFAMVTESIRQHADLSREAVESAQNRVIADVEGVARSLFATQDSFQKTVETLSDHVIRGFSDAIVERIRAEKANESHFEALSGSIKQESEATRTAMESGQKRVVSDVNSVSEFLESVGKSLEARTDKLSDAISSGFADATTQRSDVGKTHSAQLVTLSQSIKTEAESTNAAMEALQKDVVSAVQTAQQSLESFVQKSQHQSTEALEGGIHKGFANATRETKESRKAQDSHFATLSTSILGEAKTTHETLATLQTRVISEIKKKDSDFRHGLGGLKLEMEKVSSNQTSMIAGVGEDIKCLDGKTHDSFVQLEASNENANAALSSTIDATKISLQKTLDSITQNMKAIDAAVRVNSAAIARVDKAVLESSSQVKSVVLDSNRSLLSQLDDELSETGRRVRGIAEFEIPRLEALAKRSRDAVEVIGGRVIGTTKKFDEMVTHHGQKPNALDRSELLSASGRLRGGSNASSTRSKDSHRMSAIEMGRV